MKTRTISERGRLYIDRNSSDPTRRGRLFHESSSRENSSPKQGNSNNTRECRPKQQ